MTDSKSLKNKGGRPLKFKTVEELQKAVDEYFIWCDNRTKKIWIEKTQSEALVSDPAPYTMSGLARRLDLSRKSLINYKRRTKYLHTIKEARMRVHEDVETRLMDKGGVGPIFNLKNNFGWKDESRQDITSKGEKIAFPTIYKPVKDEKI